MKSKQPGSAHVIITVIIVIALLGALGFIFWQNFMKAEPLNTNTETSTKTEEKKGPVVVEPKRAQVVDKEGYSFTVVDGFKKSNEQMFTYTGGLTADTTYVNDSGDYFEVLTVTAGSGIDSDYSWEYSFDGSKLMITESARCGGEGIGCSDENDSVEGIISNKDGVTVYYIAFGNKSKNDINLSYVKQFASTFKLK